ncbi:hypothetical protein ACO0LD_25440 [Undibacterium sp. Ji83W]|uniref:hypothetical protein n=1 Tax=Undibacterium sp. Ji83W TaxID=3413043 RepID=UPI003BEF5DC2
MKHTGRLTFKLACGFIARTTLLHLLTYLIIGAISYRLYAYRMWEGEHAVPGLRDPHSQFVQTWILPTQLLRGILHGIIFLPLRQNLLKQGKWGGLIIASILIFIGAVGGINGAMEALVYTTGFNLELFLTHFPEIVVQTLLFAYLLLAWEARIDRKNLRVQAASNQS